MKWMTGETDNSKRQSDWKLTSDNSHGGCGGI